MSVLIYGRRSQSKKEREGGKEGEAPHTLQTGRGGGGVTPPLALPSTHQSHGTHWFVQQN